MITLQGNAFVFLLISFFVLIYYIYPIKSQPNQLNNEYIEGALISASDN